MSQKTFLLGVIILLALFSVGLAQDGQWQKVGNPYAIGRIDEIGIGHKNGTRYIFLADSSANGTIWRSIDDGAHWVRNHFRPGYYHNRIVIEPSNNSDLRGWTLMIAGEGSPEFAGPYRTANSGVDWVLKDNGLRTKSLYALDAVKDGSMNIAYVGALGTSPYYDRCYKTTDGGANWTTSQNGFTANETGIVRDICIVQDSPDYILAAYQGPTTVSTSNGIYRSSDGGANWGQLDFDPDNPNATPAAVEINPNDHSVAYITELTPERGKVIRIDNPWDQPPSLAFTVIYNYGPCQSISFDNQDNAYLAFNNNGGNPWTARLNGTSWALLPSGGSFIGDREAYSIAVDPLDDDVICVGGSLMFYFSSDQGATFEESVNSTNPMPVRKLDIDLQNSPSVLCIQSSDMLFRTTDYGENWTLRKQFVGAGGGILRQWYQSQDWLAGTNENSDYELGSGSLNRSWENGDQWYTFPEWTSTHDAVQCLAADPSHPVIYAAGAGNQAGSGEFHYSLDNGDEWGHSTVHSNTKVQGIDLRPSNMEAEIDTVIVADLAGGAFRSTNFGQTWAPINTGLSNLNATRIKYCQGQPKIALIGTTTGIFKSSNMNTSTPTWASANYGANQGLVKALKFHPTDNSIICSSIEYDDVTYTYISADTGRSWNEMDVGLQGYSIEDLAADPVYSDTFYSATEGGVYKLKNPVKSGTLADDETWGPGTIIVNGDVTVPSGVTLTIAPGTDVKFVYNFDKLSTGSDPYKSELIVQGTLDCDDAGNQANPVVFESSEPTSQAAGQWYAIRADSASSVSMAYCVVEHSVFGIKAYKPSTFYVDHCDIEQNTTSGIYAQYLPSNSHIRYSRILNSGTYGIYNLLGSTLVSYDTLTNNRYGVWAYGGSPTIDHCKITFTSTPNNSYNGIETGSYQSIGTSAIQASFDTIYGFNQGGIYFNAVSSQGSITDCRIISCNVTGVYCNGCSPFIGSGSSTGYTKIASNNIGIDMDKGSSPTVRRTKFYENKPKGINIRSGCWPDLGSSVDYGDNSFVRITGGLNEYHIYNGNVTSINALYNYWDPLDPSMIFNVQYSPYLSNDPLPRITSPNSQWANLPNDLELAQAYPNPFNPTTTISFNLNSPQQVSVDIYNVMGQKVRDLSNEYRQSGTVSLIWDGKDNTGQTAATGVYFCSIRTDTKQQTVKLTILK
jgi:photosystem II stability/assembly factor-like uncharacterized protein